MNSIVMDRRLKNKVELMVDWKNGVCSIEFKDLEDTFWFNSKEELQDFVRQQERERYLDKSLRKGYFLYTNENNEIFKYNVECNRGELTLINEEFVSMAI